MTLTEQYKTWLAETPEFWKNTAKSAYKKEKARLDAHAKRLQAVIDHHQDRFEMSVNDHENHFRASDIATAKHHKGEVEKLLNMQKKMKKTGYASEEEIESVSKRHKGIGGK